MQTPLPRESLVQLSASHLCIILILSISLDDSLEDGLPFVAPISNIVVASTIDLAARDVLDESRLVLLVGSGLVTVLLE